MYIDQMYGVLNDYRNQVTDAYSSIAMFWYDLFNNLADCPATAAVVKTHYEGVSLSVGGIAQITASPTFMAIWHNLDEVVFPAINAQCAAVVAIPANWDSPPDLTTMVPWYDSAVLAATMVSINALTDQLTNLMNQGQTIQDEVTDAQTGGDGGGPPILPG